MSGLLGDYWYNSGYTCLINIAENFTHRISSSMSEYTESKLYKCFTNEYVGSGPAFVARRNNTFFKKCKNLVL